MRIRAAGMSCSDDHAGRWFRYWPLLSLAAGLTSSSRCHDRAAFTCSRRCSELRAPPAQRANEEPAAPSIACAGHRRGSLDSACEPAPAGVRAGSSRSSQKLAPSLQHSSDAPSRTSTPTATSQLRALRMPHGSPNATERARRRSEVVEGDPKGICLARGEGQRGLRSKIPPVVDLRGVPNSGSQQAAWCLYYLPFRRVKVRAVGAPASIKTKSKEVSTKNPRAAARHAAGHSR